MRPRPCFGLNIIFSLHVSFCPNLQFPALFFGSHDLQFRGISTKVAARAWDVDNTHNFCAGEGRCRVPRGGEILFGGALKVNTPHLAALLGYCCGLRNTQGKILAEPKGLPRL